MAICDAETDGDLDAIVAAALAADPRTRLAGAGGLAAALARTLGGTVTDVPRPAKPAGDAPLLVIVGTVHPGVSDQVELLLQHGVQQITLSADEPQDIAAPRLRRALEAGPAVLTTSGPLTGAWEEIVTGALAGRPANLVLTGGGTARRVLDALGVRELTPPSDRCTTAPSTATRPRATRSSPGPAASAAATACCAWPPTSRLTTSKG
ncbi:hypothetical protein [Nonomuraea salmonea]|uniref:hypothetical protein n=1 Tax=Nonomuraea salmonea TaxID=46181 RepID=UPI002FEC8902